MKKVIKSQKAEADTIEFSIPWFFGRGVLRDKVPSCHFQNSCYNKAEAFLPFPDSDLMD